MSKVAMVTGGGRGIGLGIVQELAAEGFTVAIIGSSPEKRYKEALDALKKDGVEYCYIQGTVADIDSIHRSVAAVHDRFGRIDALVNNAGVAPDTRADLLDMSPESFDRVCGINTRGTMFMSQTVARVMIRQETVEELRGVIINISSVSAEVSSVSRGEYCVSKAGISMLTRLFADRLAKEGVNVYEIRPGIIDTDMTAAVKEKYDALIAGGITPIPRWGYPRDIGLAVAALCSGKFLYTTGQVINIDGGMHIQRL